MNRIQNIKTYAMKKEAEKILNEANEQIELNKLACEIENLWDRAKELLEVANACMENGIQFTFDKRHFRSLQASGNYPVGASFVSSPISHNVGFGAYSHGPVAFGMFALKRFNAISKRGGDCDFELDLCDGKVHYFGKDAKYAMKRFLEEFDEFEESFYAYIDHLTLEE